MSKTLLCSVLFALILFVNAKKVTISKEPLQYEDAVEYCKNSGGVLYLPKTMEKNGKVMDNMKELGLKRIWIGGRNYGRLKDSIFMDGNRKPIKANRLFWGPGEPSNFNGKNERCIEMRVLAKNTRTANWNDAPCTHKNYFYCK